MFTCYYRKIKRIFKWKFLLEKIAHAIPKFKGTSDIRTARGLIGAVKRGYPICIFPEGNTTFNGETTYIEESTMKLIKKLKILKKL